ARAAAGRRFFRDLAALPAGGGDDDRHASRSEVGALGDGPLPGDGGGARGGEIARIGGDDLDRDGVVLSADEPGDRARCGYGGAARAVSGSGGDRAAVGVRAGGAAGGGDGAASHES